MSLSGQAKAAWIRILDSQNKVGFLVLVTGYAAVNNVTGIRGANSLVESPLVGYQSNFTALELQGNRIQVNDKKIIIDSSQVIDNENKVKVGGNSYNIEGKREVDFSDELVGYELHLRPHSGS